MVTRQPQIERRTAKVRLSETDVLPLWHATDRDRVSDLLAMVEVLGTNKQFPTDDDVETDLDHDWNEEEQRELGHLEGRLPGGRMSSGEHKHTQLDVVAWWTTQRVVEKGWQTAE